MTYKQIKTETSMAERISGVIDQIDTLRAQRKAIQAEIEADKARRAEAKAKTNENCNESADQEETPNE